MQETPHSFEKLQKDGLVSKNGTSMTDATQIGLAKSIARLQNHQWFRMRSKLVRIWVSRSSSQHQHQSSPFISKLCYRNDAQPDKRDSRNVLQLGQHQGSSIVNHAHVVSLSNRSLTIKKKGGDVTSKTSMDAHASLGYYLNARTCSCKLLVTMHLQLQAAGDDFLSLDIYHLVELYNTYVPSSRRYLIIICHMKENSFNQFIIFGIEKEALLLSLSIEYINLRNNKRRAIKPPIKVKLKHSSLS